MLLEDRSAAIDEDGGSEELDEESRSVWQAAIVARESMRINLL